jgi:cytidylate kinase
MSLLSVIGTVVFLGVLALALVAVFDVFVFKSSSKRARRRLKNSPANAQADPQKSSEETFTRDKPDHQS